MEQKTIHKTLTSLIGGADVKREMERGVLDSGNNGCGAETVDKPNAGQVVEYIARVLGQTIEAIAETTALKVTEAVERAIKSKEPRYYSREEAARILKVTLPTLHTMTKNGMITAKKAGRRVLYDADALDEAVKEERVYKYKRYRKEVAL